MCRILHLSAYEDGTDRVFSNVDIQNSDAGELPRRKHTKLTLVNGVTDDPGSNPDQKYARRTDRQILQVRTRAKVSDSIEHI
jgi:hypothetical protein